MIKQKNSQSDTEEKMKTDMVTIMLSVEWIARETDKLIDKLKKEEENATYYNEEKIELLKTQINSLLKKLHLEDQNITNMLSKYPALKKYVKD